MPIPLPPENIKCRYTAFKKKCRDLCMNCPAWIHIQGVDANTGEAVDHYNCSDAWIPVLLMDNTKKQIETGAAIESFRNEIVKQNNQILHVAHGGTLALKNENE